MPIINDLNFDFSRDDYEMAKERFIGLCNSSEIPVDNIGFFGKVGFPGISDIDALVFANPKDIRRLIQQFDRMRADDSRFAYLFWHPPLYVLENITNIAGYLHTLENITPAKAGGDISDFCKQFSSDEKVPRALNIAWFVYLVQIVGRQSSIFKKNGTVSLRLLLLVYNNLFHSFTIFKGGANPNDNSIISSQKLRETVKNVGFDNDLEKFVEDSFFILYQNAITAFDNYCRENFIGLELSKKTTLIAGQNLIFKKSSSTKVNCRKFYNEVLLNPIAFQMVSDYYHGSSHARLFEEYVSKSERARFEYFNENIQYAFIKPVRNSESSFKRKSLYFINRFL